MMLPESLQRPPMTEAERAERMARTARLIGEALARRRRKLARGGLMNGEGRSGDQERPSPDFGHEAGPYYNGEDR